MILDGKAVAAKVLAEVKAGAAAYRDRTGAPPTLAVVLVGEDPASALYVRSKKKDAEEVGIASRDFLYPGGCSQSELLATIKSINADRGIHGVLVQLPLPKGLNEDEIIAAIAPEKDADGLHPMSLGHLLAGKPTMVPCTPAGCLEILDHYGIPLAAHCRRADILCVAAGRARMITGDMVKDGVVVIDVGTNRLETGKLAGDVDFASVSPKARAITPVPGGVGPMTRAMLMRNTLRAAQRQAGLV